MSLLTIPRTLGAIFRPAIDGLFAWHLPWRYRWRLFVLQPVALLTFAISRLTWAFSHAYTVEYLPVAPGVVLRALVFRAPGKGTGRGGLRPLHVDIHGGAFIGGWGEDDAIFCDQVARETGAVVVSLTYRFAPAHGFPTAIDDVDAAIRFVQIHAEARWGADATLMTTGGFSAGGNLALAASQAPNCQPPSPTNIKGTVVFCAAIDLRLKPDEKPVPKNYPTSDPLAVLLPLFDSYAAPVRARNMENPRLNPILAHVDTLPPEIYLGVSAIDILSHEQLSFAERVQKEYAADPKKYAGRRVEVGYDEKGFHGHLNLPDTIIPNEQKQILFRPAIRMLKDIHQKHHWRWDA